jgi:predicted phosphodiesterase
MSLKILHHFQIKQPFNVAILGDSKKGIKVLEKLIKIAKKNDCKAVFHLGDVMPYNNEKYYKYFYEELRSLIHEYKIPIFIIPGNHDSKDEKEHYDINRFEKYFGHNNDIIKITDALFLYLDDSSGKITQATLKNFSDKMTIYKNKLRFILFHIPTKDPRQNKNHALDDNKSLTLLENFIKKNNFNAVFSAHIHSHCIYKIGTVPCYITGEAGAYLIRGRDYSYLQLSINGKTFNVKRKVVNWEFGLNFLDYFETKMVKYLN